jgi:uncharacterized membrane protein YbaN (DUF454 family)
VASIKKVFFIAAGYASLTMGVVGIVVPLLPTIPFLLLAAACFFRGSPMLYQWLIHHKIFGNSIRCYREFHAVSHKTRITSIILLWLSIGFAAIYAVEALWLRIILLAVALGVSLHLVRLKKLTKEMIRHLK